jgi:murein DD-endopeptidase MepM/ murein hydrolase activator NlpD
MSTQMSTGNRPENVLSSGISGDAMPASLLSPFARVAKQGLRLAPLGLACVWLVSLVAGCGGGGSPTEPDTPAQCGPYPDQLDSPWVLPYPVGDSYAVVQGNCDGRGHAAGTTNQYAYDFGMPTGSAVVATGSGVVVGLEEGESNDKAVKGSWGAGNFVTIQHPNGLSSAYAHLEQWSVLVEIGEFVSQGQLIARSGNSGTYNPHLHFGVYASGYATAVTFRNTRAHPNGLVLGEVYTAEGY